MRHVDTLQHHRMILITYRLCTAMCPGHGASTCRSVRMDAAPNQTAGRFPVRKGQSTTLTAADVMVVKPSVLAMTL